MGHYTSLGGAWLYDANSLDLLSFFSSYDFGIASVALNRDGTVLAYASRTGTVVVCDVATRKVLHTFKVQTVPSISFDKTGRIVAIASWDMNIYLLDIGSGSISVLQGHTRYVVKVDFSADGSRLVSSGYDGTVRIWDTASAKEVGVLQGFGDAAFSPTDMIFAAGNIHQRVVSLFDVASLEERQVFGPFNECPAYLTFDKTGSLLAGRFPSSWVRLWSVRDQTQVYALNSALPHVARASPIAFSPNGERLFIVSREDEILSLSVKNSTVLGTLKGHTEPVRSIAFTNDAKRIVSGHSKSIRVWDIATGEELAYRPHDDGVSNAELDSNGRIIYADDKGQLLQWDLEIGSDFILFTVPARASCIANHLLSRLIVTASANDGMVRVWSLSGQREIQRLGGHAGPVSTVAFDPKGRFIATGGIDQTVRLWNIETGREVSILTEETSAKITAIDFSADGRLLVASSYGRFIETPNGKQKLGGAVILWDLRATLFAPKANSSTVQVFSENHDVMSVTLSPDGKWLASGGDHMDSKVHVRDLKNDCRHAFSLRGHTEAINCVAFDPKSAVLASGGDDGVISLWRV